jgi:hypothetical protein
MERASARYAKPPIALFAHLPAAIPTWPGHILADHAGSSFRFSRGVPPGLRARTSRGSSAPSHRHWRPPLAVVTAAHSQKPIRTIQDLKGTAVAVSSPGSSNHCFLNYLLVKNDLTPSDISAVGVGLNFSMAAALDCVSAEGSRQTLGTDNLPFIALIARSDWLNGNEEAARRVGQVMSGTVTWIHAHAAEQVRDPIPQRYRMATLPCTWRQFAT